MDKPRYRYNHKTQRRDFVTGPFREISKLVGKCLKEANERAWREASFDFKAPSTLDLLPPLITHHPKGGLVVNGIWTHEPN